MSFGVVVTTVGILALIGSLMALAFPSFSRKVVMRYFKNNKTIRKEALMKLIIAIILILIGINI